MTIAKTVPAQLGLGFWFKWVVVGTAGWGAPWAIAIAMFKVLALFQNMPFVGAILQPMVFALPFVIVIGIGTGVALLQANLLRKHIARPDQWTRRSAFSLGLIGTPAILLGGTALLVALLIADLYGTRYALPSYVAEVLIAMVAFGIAGAAVGFGQRPMIKECVSGPTRWVLFSSISFALIGLALAMPIVASQVFTASSLATWLLSLAVPLVVAHSITAARIVFVFRHPAQPAQAVDGAPAEAIRLADAIEPAIEQRSYYSKKAERVFTGAVAAVTLLTVAVSLAAIVGPTTLSDILSTKQSGRKPVLISLRGPSNNINRFVFSPDWSSLAGSSSDGYATVWDAASGRELFTLTGHTGPVNGIAYSPDGKRLVTVSWDQTVKVWDAGTGGEQLTLTSTSGLTGLALSPDGTRLAAIDMMGVEIWDLPSRSMVLTLLSPADQIYAIAFSPDGRHLATTGQLADTATIWDAATGQVLFRLTGHARPVNDIVFSPDGRRVATASQDGTAIIWDAATGKELLRLGDSNRNSAVWVRAVAFSPDGKRLATGGGVIRLWDAATGQELLTLSDGSNDMGTVFFSPDGKRLGAVSDSSTEVWDAQP